MGLQLCEAQSPFLGPSFFLLSRTKSAQNSGSEGVYITAVETGMILDLPGGAKTQCFK